MKATEVTAGRTFGVTFDHGDDFMTSLARFCHENNVRLTEILRYLTYT